MTAYVENALTPLIGRERELRALESWLDNGARLVTLTGPGGSGKTALARELFGRRRRQGGEGYFVDLVGISDPGLVPTEIAAELGVTETADVDAAGVVAAALRDSTAVIVLDNVEELTGARDFLAELLRAAPELQLIATSRIPIGIPGEVEFQVPPLELPRGDARTDVEGSPAGALFLERARAVGRLDDFDPPTARAIAELCRRLDGLPLALELAAARTRIMPPASILRHLAQRRSGLLAKVGEEDIRHASLGAVLSWSMDLLESNETEVLAAVAICPGGFDLAMAEALAPDLNVLQALDVLATHGLLMLRSEVEGEPWYRLLETIRTAAIERAATDQAGLRWEQLAIHLSERVAGTLEAFYRIDDAAFRSFDVLLDNIRAALDWCDAYQPALSLSIAGHFYAYWRIRGQHREGLRRLRTAIAANPQPSPDLAIALTGLAVLERNVGGMPEVRRAAAEATRIARSVRAPDLEVLALEQLVLGGDEPSQEVSDRLRELLATIDHPVSRFGGLNALAWNDGVASGFRSEVQFRYYRDAEDALTGTPYRRFAGVVAANLTQVYLYRNEAIQAYEQSTRALSMLQEGGPELLAWVHALRATAAAGRGEINEATASLRSAFDRRNFGAMGLPPEVLVAAVAVLTASNAPLLAAKVWGAATAAAFGASPANPDHALGERLLVTARRASDPVAFQMALGSGERAGAAAVVDEVLAYLDGVAEASAQAGPARLQHGTLTQRETEVLGLVGAGKSDADIAAELFISPKTASVHVSNAKAKIGVETRLEAALWAREQGLVDDTRDAR